MRTAELRPVERRVLRLSESGMDEVEIAWRLRRTPRYVRQVADLAKHPRRAPTDRSGQLRPIERRLLRWREQGIDPEDLAPLFRRSTGFLQQVERLAHYKLANGASYPLTK